MLASLHDTIVACATPQGQGALAVVRLSGPLALEIGQKLVPTKKQRISHKMYVSRIYDSNKALLDEGMLAEMHAPHSYTGEESVEFYLHGSKAIVSSVIDACCTLGARLAEPGEFTMRAFIHGKMDLTQAEAVADVIASENAGQRDAALRQLKGVFAKQVGELVDTLEAILTDWRAVLDFPEYPTGEGLVPEHFPALKGAEQALNEHIERGQKNLRERSHIVLCGAPNVGKSSLLNAWTGEERVLVDDVAGTTRDPIEVILEKGSSRLSVWDTAGIRNNAEGLEAKGIALTLERARKAELCVWLLSGVQPELPQENLPIVIVGSKADLTDETARQKIADLAATKGLHFWGWISLQTGEGVEALRDWLFMQREEDQSGSLIKERHVKAMQTALQHLVLANDSTSLLPLDLRALELELAIKALAQILGRDVDAEVLKRIFATFCIGK